MRNGILLFICIFSLVVLQCPAFSATVVTDTRTNSVVEMHGHDVPEADALSNAKAAGVPEDKIQVIYGEEAQSIIEAAQPRPK